MKKKIEDLKYILLAFLIINNLIYKSQVTTNTLSSTNIIGQATVDSVLIAKDTIVAKRDVRIVGNLKVKGEARFKDNLKVDGNTIFNGNLKISNFIGTPGLSKVFVDGNGFLQKGITFPASWECVPGSPNWNIGGNNFTSQAFPGITAADIGTCDNAEFILKSNNVFRAWFKTDGTVGFGTAMASNSGGAEYKFHQGAIRLSGLNTFGGPQIIFDGGINPYGDWGVEYTSALTKNGLNFWKPFGSQNSNNNIFFLADDGTIGMGTDNPSTRLTVDAWTGDGIKNITSNLNSKALWLVNNSTPNTPLTNFLIYGDGRIDIASPTINNNVGVNPYPVQPFLINMNSSNQSGIKIRSSSNIAYNPQIMVGNTVDNKDQFFVFGDGTTYIGDNWNATGISSQIYVSKAPKLAAQVNSAGGNQQNRAAFSASVKNQNINEAANNPGYCATFDSDNKNTRAISVICTDPSLNLPVNTFYEPFRVYADGRTYIGGPKVGGSHSNALLQVSGEIVCKSLYVIKPVSWQDKVFNKDYKLLSLSEVEKFIIKNNHLPGIKSEKEILENGYDVNEVDALLLEKIENLYLYVIKQEKEISELKKKLNEKN